MTKLRGFKMTDLHKVVDKLKVELRFIITDRELKATFQDIIGVAPVIPPFLESAKSRGYAAKASFCFGVMPPSAMLGRS